jgi:cell division protein FtsB
MADQPDPSSESAPTPERRPRVRKRARTPQEAKQWRRRMAGYALAVAAFILVVNALVGENGYLATMSARRERDRLEREVRQTQEQNAQMREQIRQLKTNPKALEDAARKELRMSKPGETVVIIKDGAKPTPTPTPPAK